MVYTILHIVDKAIVEETSDDARRALVKLRGIIASMLNWRHSGE